MKSAASVLMAAWLVLTPAAARAGAARCWIDQGALVIPAIVAGVPGDYILDTGAPQTLLHETRAQGAGLAATAFPADVRFAGRSFRARPVAVADLDARTAAFPTPIAGVLGADLLDGLILDVSFSPCRVGLYEPRRAPRFHARAALPLRRLGGRLAAPAIVTDGKRLVTGDFVLATGSGAGVTLAQDLIAGDAKPGAVRRLRALSFAGGLQENLTTEVVAADSGVDAALGAPALARYRLRFDLAHGRLRLAPGQQKGPPDRADGP